MLNDLKDEVYEANMELLRRGLTIYTWGNVSGIDRKKGLMAIKPSGIEYEKLSSEDIVIIDIESGKIVEGNFRPSSDTNTHIELYRSFSDIGGIAHTHSAFAVGFAQAGMDIPALGTTHADYFYGNIPCTRELRQEEVQDNYEKNTGTVIAETIMERNIHPAEIPGIIVRNHGVFAYGKSAAESVYHAVILEKVAEMAYRTISLNPQISMEKYILNKHYKRKHGVDAYYGQNN